MDPPVGLDLADHPFDSDYIPLVNLLGVYFQIRDDYMNLQSTEVGSRQLINNSAVSLIHPCLSMRTTRALRRT